MAYLLLGVGLLVWNRERHQGMEGDEMMVLTEVICWINCGVSVLCVIAGVILLLPSSAKWIAVPPTKSNVRGTK